MTAPVQAIEASNPHTFVPGIESLRLLAAVWVACSHGAAPPLEQIFHLTGGPMRLAAGGFAALFNGTAAVVVFFLISGFCIHLPNVGRTQLDWPRFLIRRLIRIGGPLAAILAIAHALGKTFVGAEDAVLWSVYCELIYYALYPLLFLVFKRGDAFKMVAIGLLCTVALLFTRPHAEFLWEFGPLTWLYCGVYWLLGAWLAEVQAGRAVLRVAGPVFLWRIGALAFCAATTVALYHLPIKIGLVWTMPPFGFYSLFWLRVELKAFALKGTSPLIEALGAACYSIYLVHNMVIAGVTSVFGPVTSIGAWLLVVGGITVATSAFYFAVEKPSHQLARHLGRRRPLLPQAETA